MKCPICGRVIRNHTEDMAMDCYREYLFTRHDDPPPSPGWSRPPFYRDAVA